MSKKEIILKILEGLNEESKLLSAKDLGINDEFWNETIQIIYEARMIFDISVTPFGNDGQAQILGRNKAKISINGIEYLEHNKQ